MNITFAKPDATGHRQLYVDDCPYGHAKPGPQGKGYLLKVDGIRWQTAPGARYAQEKDFRAEYTYVTSLTGTIAKARIIGAMNVLAGRPHNLPRNTPTPERHRL